MKDIVNDEVIGVQTKEQEDKGKVIGVQTKRQKDKGKVIGVDKVNICCIKLLFNHTMICSHCRW